MFTKTNAKRNVTRTLLAAMAVVAALWGTNPGPAQAAGLLVADGGFGGVLEIEEHEVDVVINNGIAVTRITQVFRNKENRIVEALYTFPVPKGASVSNFSMWIAGKEMVGEVVEKKRAREIYESYKKTKRDPGLLEQVDYKTFEMRIFPIAAAAAQKIELTYYQELDFDHDWATYVYPLATVTRKDIDSRSQGRFAVSVAVKSEVPVVKLECPSHGDQVELSRRTDRFHEASLETQGGDLNRDFVLAYQASRPKTGLDLVASRQNGEDGVFCLTLTAGEELEKVNAGMDFVFIVDISGSMANAGKLDTSVNAVWSFVKTLGKEDRFEIITFNNTPRLLFKALAEADDAHRDQAREFLGSQEARGGTVLRPAVNAAYKYKNADRTLNAVILSDGMTEQRERGQLLDLIRTRPDGTRVFCIGVGNEVNRPLLRQLAEDSGGLAAFISQGDNFDRQAQAFRRKLMHPAATDVTIVFEGGGVQNLLPERLPNLYHGAPLRLYGQYTKPGTVQVRVEAFVNGRKIETKGELEFPATETANPEIERMWAWHKVEALKKQLDAAGGSDTAITDEIVRLGEGYSIVTEHTSFLVLENDAEYKRWKIDRRNATRIARDRRAQQKLRAQLDDMRDKALASIGPEAAEEKKPVEIAQAAPPRQARPGAARPTQVQSRPSAQPRRSRGVDFNLPRGGGGAVDPLTGLVMGALAGVALLAARGRKED